jgi:flavin-dependent dehydrogenase
MTQHDVIVVGGSVSGAPTATWLARKGYKVLVLDRAQFPRDANSTHFIWPRGMSYLNRLGVAGQITAATPSFTNLQINVEDIRLHGHVPLDDLRRRFKQLHGDAEGVVGYYAGPRRHFLDKLLLDHAAANGVEVREQCTVKSLLRDADGRVTGVTAVDADGIGVTARARVVIGADGRISQFATMAGAHTLHAREKSTFAYYGYFRGIDLPELVIHKRGRFGTAIFPTQDDVHLVLVYGPTAWWSDFSVDAERNFLKTYRYVAPEVADQIERAERTEPFKAMGRMVAFHRQLFGPSWALVGDAGSFKDQWTAMGITHALRDAELISQYLDAHLKGVSSWDDAMAAYSNVRMRDYQNYWNFVCDGAEMNPYTADQLAYFSSVSRDPNTVNQLIARIGDTVDFDQPIEMPANRVEECAARFGQFAARAPHHYENPFLAVAEAAAAI